MKVKQIQLYYFCTVLCEYLNEWPWCPGWRSITHRRSNGI